MESPQVHLPRRLDRHKVHGRPLYSFCNRLGIAAGSTRRELITLLGAAATWPLTARAQQPAMPVIGLLGTTPLGNNETRLRAFRQGLKEIGYVEGENVALEYRWAEDQIDRP
jgi:hypothetical protein